MKVYESAPHPESPNMYGIKNRAQRFYRPHAASSRLPETIYNLAPRSTIWIRYDSQWSVSLQASSSSKFVWLWKFHVKIWGLDTQIWFWILWQSSYRLGTMTIGPCYTSSKSFLRTTKSRNFSPEKSWFAQFCSPLWKPLRFAVLWFFFPVFLDLWLICRNTPTGSRASSWVSGKVADKV